MKAVVKRTLLKCRRFSISYWARRATGKQHHFWVGEGQQGGQGREVTPSRGTRPASYHSCRQPRALTGAGGPRTRCASCPWPAVPRCVDHESLGTGKQGEDLTTGTATRNVAFLQDWAMTRFGQTYTEFIGDDCSHKGRLNRKQQQCDKLVVLPRGHGGPWGVGTLPGALRVPGAGTAIMLSVPLAGKPVWIYSLSPYCS